jgi:hypothetical protein
MQHFLIPIIVLISILTSFAQFGGGTGTQSDPFQIANIEQLNNIRRSLNAHFLLTSDLDFSQSPYARSNSSETKGWVPIGTNDTQFIGSFNGGAHTIKNLYINDKELSSAGLFGSVKKAVIKNIGLESCDIKAGNFTGGVVGWVFEKTQICSVFVTGTITGLSCVGGVAGTISDAYGISCSYSTATVTGTAGVGGLVGSSKESIKNIVPVIKNCYSTGLVFGNEDVGGLIGDMVNNDLSNCYSVGVVFGIAEQGALTGSCLNSTVNNCFWNIDISGLSGKTQGTGVSGKLMMSTSTYTEISSKRLTSPWDFKGNPFNDTNKSDVWFISDGKSYPGLSAFNNHPVLTVTPQIDTVRGNDTLIFRLLASDVEGDELENVNVVSGPDFGKISINDSAIFYYPDSTFTGTDELIVQTSDKKGKKSNQVKISVVYTVSFACGDGSLQNPYGIKTVNQLNGIRHHLDKNYMLMNNIDFAGTSFDSINSVGFSGWEPIGTKNKEFSGSFNGKGYSIKNLYINRSENIYVGLFGYASHAKLDSITIFDCRVSGGGAVGSLIGLCDSTIVSNCSATGLMRGFINIIGGIIGRCQNRSLVYNCHTDMAIYGKTFVGGLVGMNVSNVRNSFSRGILRGESDIGGITGGNYYSATIDSCIATDTIIATGDYVGGITGSCYNANIENCRFSGCVEGINSIGGLSGECVGNVVKISNCYAESNSKGRSCIGGLIGCLDGGSSSKSDSIQLSYCFANGIVAGSTRVGGLIGSLNTNGTIFKCHSSGEVKGDSSYSGGLVGSIVCTEPSIVDSCYSICTVQGTNFVGGLIGHCHNTQLSNSYSTGIVNGNDTVGGLAGYAYSGVTEVRNCHAKGAVHGNNLLGGLIGYNDMNVYECSATGAVTGSGIKIGGFVGLNVEKVENCYATGNCVGKAYVGGFAGVDEARALINKCFSVGKIQGENNIGGFAGHKYYEGIISNCFWDKEASGIDTSKGGIGKTTADFRNVKTFTDKSTMDLSEPWDFVNNPYNDTATTDIWQYDDGEIYPRLREYLRILVNTVEHKNPKTPADLIVSVSGRNLLIGYNAKNPENIKVSLFDLSGRLLFSNQYKAIFNGRNKILIPLGKKVLTTGMYIISIDTENVSKRLRVSIF